MTAETRLQPDNFERLRSALGNASWGHEFLAAYVNELGKHAQQDIFRRMAFGYRGAGAASSMASTFLELYEGLSCDEKTELRRLWLEKVRREAYHYNDLRERLSWRYLV